MPQGLQRVAFLRPPPWLALAVLPRREAPRFPGVLRPPRFGSPRAADSSFLPELGPLASGLSNLP